MLLQAYLRNVVFLLHRMWVEALQGLPAAEFMFSALAGSLTVDYVYGWRSERLEVVEGGLDLRFQLNFMLQECFLAWLRYW